MKYFDQNTIVFFNGEYIKASQAKSDLFAQSLHYGNAVFDAFRAYGTSLGPHIFKAEEHLARFSETAQKMHHTMPYSVRELIKISYELLERNNFTDAYIRPLIYSGMNMELSPDTKHHLFIAAWKWEKYLGKDLLDIKISDYKRPSPLACDVEAKVSGNYANSVAAVAEAQNAGFDDALLLDVEGKVAEGTGANFFFEKDGILFTPKKGHIFPGITRSVVLNLCKQMGQEVVEGVFFPEDLKDLDGAFFTGTAAQITGIASIDGHKMNKDWEDTIGYQVFEKYGHIVTQNEYDSYSII
ncbi:branched-chain-amino-acid transaminase [Sediminitomix flava]|uniref:Branched-chain-amino-acid aminotransferase n=1 Tax=Sediminitomix flava TaxID=379075 RepID=A0A315Z816_SEDFL|nr:branched-chain-amino-acid transaminase [Sediminitomix flava]PWJ40065.1 branched-chain amino acid aminotransferase [Sediminitomix flava]